MLRKRKRTQSWVTRDVGEIRKELGKEREYD